MPGNILLVWDRMGDYHRARWSAVENAFKEKVVYGADFGVSDDLYGWANTLDQPNYLSLSNKKPDQFDIKRIFRFAKIVSKYNIEVVCIAGYGRFEYLIFLIYSKLARKKVILFAESWYPSSRAFDFIKSIFLKLVCDGFLVSGVRAEHHFTQHLGIAPSKVKTGYSVVDNEHFVSASVQKEKKSLLCVARFSKEKNLILLLNAFIKSKMEQNGWKLLLVGGGPQKEELQTKGVGHSIKITDWQSYECLPQIYQEASVFILPSAFEPWGLVVNEAMAASLPIILSTEVGCMPNLLKEGENGWSFVSDDEEHLITVLNNVSALDNHLLLEMGKSSREIITNFAVSTFSNNLKWLVESN